MAKGSKPWGTLRHAGAWRVECKHQAHASFGVVLILFVCLQKLISINNFMNEFVFKILMINILFIHAIFVEGIVPMRK